MSHQLTPYFKAFETARKGKLSDPDHPLEVQPGYYKVLPKKKKSIRGKKKKKTYSSSKKSNRQCIYLYINMYSQNHT